MTDISDLDLIKITQHGPRAQIIKSMMAVCWNGKVLLAIWGPL